MNLVRRIGAGSLKVVPVCRAMADSRFPVAPVLTALIACVSVGASVGSAGTLNQPNILLLVSEENGAELGCYGTPDVRTPRLDQLAAEGSQFSNAYVPNPVCSASRAAFLTGLDPFQNGQIGLATHRYAMYQAWQNIPAVLRQAGYRTGLIGKLHVNRNRHSRSTFAGMKRSPIVSTPGIFGALRRLPEIFFRSRSSLFFWL